MKLAVENDMLYNNAKYTLLQMAYPESERAEFHKKLIQCKTMQQIW